MFFLAADVGDVAEDPTEGTYKPALSGCQGERGKAVGALVHGSWALGRVTLAPLAIATAEGA